jgi:hypothetical protein
VADHHLILRPITHRYAQSSILLVNLENKTQEKEWRHCDQSLTASIPEQFTYSEDSCEK